MSFGAFLAVILGLFIPVVFLVTLFIQSDAQVRRVGFFFGFFFVCMRSAERGGCSWPLVLLRVIRRFGGMSLDVVCLAVHATDSVLRICCYSSLIVNMNEANQNTHS